MILIKLSYKDPDWEIKNLEFDKVCLLVGKNSTGKSKTLFTIDYLGKLINQKIDFHKRTSWDITFQDADNLITYKFSTSYIDNYIAVDHEQIQFNKETVLLREDSEIAEISNFLSKGKEKIYPPANKLVIHTNRDVKKYPFLEDIAIWAENSFGFKFGSIGPDRAYNQQEYNLLTAVE